MFIKIRVFPNSLKEELKQKSTDSFEIKIKEKPERGLANKRLIQILANYFQLPESKISLIKGFKQRNKIFKIDI